MTPIRIYVGTDRSQALAVKVLEFSAKRRTSREVQVIPMLDLPVPPIHDLRNSPRTGFSFSRFMIPALANYQGRAIYMDADMLVLKDIQELWDIPFHGRKIIIQKDLTTQQSSKAKTGTPTRRIRQCAVMLIDCEKCDWDIRQIVDGLNDKKFDYEDLMYDLCILQESEISQDMPFEWNSLEHWDESTGNIHYTDMNTQPWVYSGNPHAHHWFAEVRAMIDAGALQWSEIRNEINLGYFRPTLGIEVKTFNLIPSFLRKAYESILRAIDKAAGYKPHKAVYAAKLQRDQLIRLQSQTHA